MKSGVNDIRQLSGLVIGFYWLFWTFSTDSLVSKKDKKIMKIIKIISLLILIICATQTNTIAKSKDINTQLMHATFKIEGPSTHPGKTTYGTVFFIGKVQTEDTSKGYSVMITAAHVLEGIAGETATLYLRKKIDKNQYERIAINLKIRNRNTPLWVKHPDTDIAAMRVNIFKFIEQTEDLLADTLLADDALFEELEIHPGDELFCLGYPYGIEANSMGFPILRSGKIASFPLTPAKTIKSFMFDFEIFGGNSGGPVYFCQSNRSYGEN